MHKNVNSKLLGYLGGIAFKKHKKGINKVRMVFGELDTVDIHSTNSLLEDAPLQ